MPARATERSPVPVFLLISGANAALLALYGTLSAIYRIRDAGLDPLELILVGTALELSVFVFEIPTGVVADVWSRRLSVRVGYALMGVGFLVEGFFPSLGPILLAQAIWGFGYTFTSGALQAWIVDEVEGEGVGDLFLRASVLAQAGALIGIAAAVAFGSVLLALPLRAAGVGFLALSGLLFLVMPERRFRPRAREERRTWGAYAATLRQGVGTFRGRPLLLWLLLAAVLVGASSEPLDRLWELRLLESFSFPALGALDPIVWFGIINAAALGLGIVATETLRRSVDLEPGAVASRALALLNALLVVSVLVFALAGSFALALGAYLATRVLRRLEGPVLAVWVNRHVPSEVRATVLSMMGQGDALGQVVGGPALGGLGRVAGVGAALVGTAAVLAPVQICYARAGRVEAARVSLPNG